MFRTSSKTEARRCVPLACFTASEITNHPVSFATATFSPPPAERRRTTRWAYSRHRDGRVITGLCLLCFVSPYPEILIPVSPRYEVGKGLYPTTPSCGSIEMNAKYQVGTFLVRSSCSSTFDKVTLLLQVQRRPEVLCWGGWFIF